MKGKVSARAQRARNRSHACASRRTRLAGIVGAERSRGRIGHYVPDTVTSSRARVAPGESVVEKGRRVAVGHAIAAWAAAPVDEGHRLQNLEQRDRRDSPMPSDAFSPSLVSLGRTRYVTSSLCRLDHVRRKREREREINPPAKRNWRTMSSYYVAAV